MSRIVGVSTKVEFPHDNLRLIAEVQGRRYDPRKAVGYFEGARPHHFCTIVQAGKLLGYTETDLRNLVDRGLVSGYYYVSRPGFEPELCRPERVPTHVSLEGFTTLAQRVVDGDLPDDVETPDIYEELGISQESVRRAKLLISRR